MHVMRRRPGRRISFTAVAAGLMLALAACGRDTAVGTAEPELPDNPPIPPQYRGAAFVVDVSTLRRTMRVTPPQGTIRNPIATGQLAGSDFARGIPRGQMPGDGPDQTYSSLVGGDVIDLVATNYVAGALGAVVPNKILVTFDLQINNKLNGVDLILPTWPTPPAGAAGVLMFPFEIGVTTTSGGVSVGGAGNEVIVTSPRGGAVAPSADWDGNGGPGSGAPHNFFNDVGCTAQSNDCFVYEEYASIPALGSSAARTVGFLIDPTVGDFRVKMIVAADLRNAGGPAQFGTVSGTVTSPQIGAISNATVSVSGGFSGTTVAGGTYSITNVGVGSRTVSVSNLPAGCTAPGSQTVNVTNGATATADFTVTCTVPTGTVSGAISSSLGGGLSGVSVVATPTGGSASSPFTTSASGAYSISIPVGAGTGAVTLSNLPANCTNPGPTNYSGLTSGGTVTLNITVTCVTPPQTGTVNGTVTSSLGGGIAGATAIVTPTGGSALPGATTDGAGAYSVANVTVGAGTGTVALSGLPANCTAPAPANYSGLTNGGTVTVDFTVTCTAAAHTYPMSLTWGAITNSGSTGRQVTAVLAIDMGAAPGLPDVNGANADELVGVQLSMFVSAAHLTYASRTLLDPNLDLGSVGSPTPGVVNIAITSGQNLTSSGNVQLVRLTFNIPAGASGTVTPTFTLVETLVGLFAAPLDKVANTIVPSATLTIP